MSRGLYLILLGYLPAILLPFITSLGYLATWIFYIIWTFYLFILLLLYYHVEKKGGAK